MSSGLAGPEGLVPVLRAALPDLLVAVDFDGTLAPLRPDPDDSRPVIGTLEALSGLGSRGAQVAVVTGRDAQTVLRLGGFEAVPGIVVAGLYGAETWTEGALATRDTPEPIDTLRTRLPGLLADSAADPDVWIEDKRLSLVVHGRKSRDPEGVLDPLREPVAGLAADLGLELHPGNGVLEIRLPGHDKAGALRALAAARAYQAVVYLGDDLGDIPAFEQITRLRAAGTPAWSIAVLSSDMPAVADAADLRVADPDEAVAFLAAI